MSTIEFHRLKIADVRRETPDAVSIAFAVPANLRDAYKFHPGQHLTLRMDKNGEDIRRSYSICTGLDDGELRVAVKKMDGGVFSTLCNDLQFKPGDEIDVMTPQGRFGLVPDPAPSHAIISPLSRAPASRRYCRSFARSSGASRAAASR